MLEQLQSCLPDLLVEGVGQILQAWEPSTDQLAQVVNDLLDSCDLREGNPVAVFEPTSHPRVTICKDRF